jgi:hypothetical protein
MERIPRDNIREDDLVLLQFWLHLAPIRGSDSFKESFNQLLFCRISETLASKMLYNHIHICVIDRTEIYRESLLINLWNFNGYIVGVVEVRDDAVDEVPDSTMTAIHQLIDILERSKLVMGIILLIIIVAIVEVIAAYSNLTVRLVLEFDFTLILLGFSFENVVPPGNLVERLVKLVLLILAIDTVLFRNLLLVSHLYLQDT